MECKLNFLFFSILSHDPITLNCEKSLSKMLKFDTENDDSHTYTI